jgi:hypothetical protein
MALPKKIKGLLTSGNKSLLDVSYSSSKQLLFKAILNESIPVHLYFTVTTCI